MFAVAQDIPPGEANFIPRTALYPYLRRSSALDGCVFNESARERLQQKGIER